MKKFIVLFISIVLSFGAKAQFGSAATFGLVAGDTLANVDTVQKIIKATAGYNAIGIQVNVNKLSGTLTGKVYLSQSFDGANYQITDSASYIPTITSSYSTPTYTNTAIIEKQTVPGVWYRVWATSTTTVSAPVQVWYTLRKNISQ